ncbi:MAG: hypothetical protein JO110_03615 [Acetobacteraceae bacterium]|nr:hypothetical protein [Acetobacteraceae bacterium]
MGPYSSLKRLGKITSRRWEGRLLRDVRETLAAQIGTPTAAQRLLIEDVAGLTLRIEKLERKAALQEPTEVEHRFCVYYRNSRRRALQALGLTEVEPPNSEADSLVESIMANAPSEQSG